MRPSYASASTASGETLFFERGLFPRRRGIWDLAGQGGLVSGSGFAAPSHPLGSMPSLSLRIYLDPEGRIGPGKIDLLEKIAAFGSIAAAGRSMGMSYRRAWELVEELNTLFGGAVVERQAGGRHGGGAQLTVLGLTLIARFRAVEQAALEATKDHLAALQAEVDRVRAMEAQAEGASMASASPDLMAPD